MKKILGFLLLFVSFHSYAQFSIRKNPTNLSAVDILYKAPPVGQGVHPAQFFEFALQVPNPKGATLTATWAPGPPLAAITIYNFYTGTEYGNTTFAWSAFDPTPTYANTFDFPATEVVLGTVIFSPASAASGALVSAIDYQYQIPYGGQGTEVAVWTFQVDPFGTEVTDYNALFYQSAPSGAVAGSTPPFTTSDGGVTNQKVSLTNALLPLKLLSFNASANGCNVALNWNTAEEKSFDHFNVQHSTDGINYKEVGKIMGNRAGSGGTYKFDYTDAVNGNNYFRLQMMDLNGRATYSGTKMVKINCDRTDISFYPNPATDKVTIKGLSAKGQVVVYCEDGRQVGIYTVSNAGMLEINISGYASGNYTAVMKDGPTVKFVKSK